MNFLTSHGHPITGDAPYSPNLLTLALPQHWTSNIAYGFAPTDDPTDDAAYLAWSTQMSREFPGYRLIEVDTAPFFARYHDASEHGVLPCMCYDVMFYIPSAE